MTKREADKILRERFSAMADRAAESKNDEELMQFTDAAHKLYISLTTYGGWAEEYKGDCNSKIPS